MGKCPEALGSQQDTVGTPSMLFPFQLPLGPWGRRVKIVIGALGQGALPFPARRGDALLPRRAALMHPPPSAWPALLMLLIANGVHVCFRCPPEELTLGTFF
jgi:hypothetical protein